jgi:hypothetical protein
MISAYSGEEIMVERRLFANRNLARWSAMPTVLSDKTKFVLSISFWERRLPDPGFLCLPKGTKGHRSNAAAALVRVFEVFSYPCLK